MEKKVLIFKKEGETPLEALEAFRTKNQIYKDVKMTYAGRLDPMASGLMLILLGEETKNKEKYLNLDKEYEFEVLFGFNTDTFDILGKVASFGIGNKIADPKNLEQHIKKNLKNFQGKFIQEYPAYSSKTLLGKALFSYAREGQKVELPLKEVVVKKLELLKIRRARPESLWQNIKKRIDKVNGDFRQYEIQSIWEKCLRDTQEKYFYLAKFKIVCGSGTYVRGIANSLGRNMGIPALAFSIKRTRIGKFDKIG